MNSMGVVFFSCVGLLTMATFTSCESTSEDLEAVGAGGHMGTGQLSLEVEHSFDNGRSFVPRGTLNIHSLRSSTASFESVVSVTDANMKALEDLCTSDGLYLLRIIGTDGTFHRTGLHACNLLQSGLSDVITVHLDWRMRVVGVSVMGASVEGSSSTSSGFKTKVLVQHMEAGPQPDTASFIQKMEQDKMAKQRGETTDNRSFLAKYWMYLIPVVLVFAMGSGGGN